MQLTSDADFNMTYGDLEFTIFDVFAIHIQGEQHYPEDEDIISIVLPGQTLEIKWEDIKDNQAREAILSQLAPV